MRDRIDFEAIGDGNPKDRIIGTLGPNYLVTGSYAPVLQFSAPIERILLPAHYCHAIGEYLTRYADKCDAEGRQ